MIPRGSGDAIPRESKLRKRINIGLVKCIEEISRISVLTRIEREVRTAIDFTICILVLIETMKVNGITHKTEWGEKG